MEKGTKKCPNCGSEVQPVHSTDGKGKDETISSEPFALYCPSCKWIGDVEEGK